MIKRAVESELRQLAKEFPVISIYGPRQSGKTTLARMAFPGKQWLSFEDPDVLAQVRNDPRGFIMGLKNGAILDEVQRFPALLSYLQKDVDKNPVAGRFILSGSHQGRLKHGVAQSLAGRTAVLTLLPLSLEELAVKQDADVFDLLYRGFYPRLHTSAIRPQSYYSAYVATYLERDLPDLLSVRNRNAFLDFLFLLASRTGQVMNLSALGNDIGVTSTTLAAWISALEESNIVFRLPSWSRNATRQVVKTPKIYFTDTGLAAHLARLHRPDDIAGGVLRGGLYENFVIMEIRKYLLNHGMDAGLYFFRDSRGNEVDLVVESGDRPIPIEIKSSSTFKTDYSKGIELFRKLHNARAGFVVYNGPADLPPYRSIGIVNPMVGKNVWAGIIGDEY